MGFKKKMFLGIVPARGGSKGLPGKNISLLAGKSLLEHTARSALGSQFLEEVILSSDDARIIEEGKNVGLSVPFVRPRSLATDEASSSSVVKHALDFFRGYQYGVLLQPTSPFRNSSDIDNCIRMCIENKAKSCVSICEVRDHPSLTYRQDENNFIKPYLVKKSTEDRRQNYEKAVRPNGAVYVFEVTWFLEHQTFIDACTLGYEMPLERSLDIDSPLDLKIAACLAQTLEIL